MKHIITSIMKEVDALEPLLVKYLLTPNEPTNQVISHIFSSGGKRIRPALFLLTCQLLEYAGEHKFPIASVCEYIHTASLLHDDVIDNSSLRRSKRTTNSIWGDETAILAGDLIYSAACRLMVKTQSLPLIDTFAECIRFMSESELFQLELLWKIETNEINYDRVVAGKTASLFEACCKTPGYLSNAPDNLIQLLGEVGRCIGYSFQITDDCLDYEGNIEMVGKSVVTDLLEGKITLPLIYALKNEGPWRHELTLLVEKIMEDGQANPEQKKILIHFVQISEGLARAKNCAKKYASAANLALDKILSIIPETALSIEAVQSLRTIISYATDRKN